MHQPVEHTMPSAETLLVPRHRPRRSDPPRALLLVLPAAVALAVGALVYLSDRPASLAASMPAVHWLAGRHLFGGVGDWLPSFAHPFAFSLLMAAALPRIDRPRYALCGAWFLVNLLFECGQHAAVREPLASAVRYLFDPLGLGPPLANYFLRGTFDLSDIEAAGLGAIGAAAVLLVEHRRSAPSSDPSGDVACADN